MSDEKTNYSNGVAGGEESTAGAENGLSKKEAKLKEQIREEVNRQYKETLVGLFGPQPLSPRDYINLRSMFLVGMSTGAYYLTSLISTEDMTDEEAQKAGELFSEVIGEEAQVGPGIITS